MKKYLSILLVLTMILSMVIPMGAFAEGNENQAIFDKLHEKFGGVAAKYPENLKNAVKRVDEDFCNSALNKFKYNLNETQKGTLKDKFGLEVDGNVKDITEDVQVWLSNESKISNLIDDLGGKSTANHNDSLAYINDLRTTITNKYGELIDKWNTTVLLDENKKIDFALDLYKSVINNLTVKETSSKKLEFSIGSGLTSDVEEIQNTYLKEEAKVSSVSVKDVAAKTADALENDFNIKIIPGGTNEVIKSFFVELGANYISYTAPSDEGSSGSSGGSSNSDADVPVTQPGKVDKEESAVEFGKDNISVQTKDGTATVTLKEYDLVAGIKNLRKSIGSDKEGKAVVDIENVEGVNVSFVLSSKIAEAISDNNISLEINAGDIQYLIPSDALKGIEIPSGAKIQFKSAEGDVESIAAAAGELGNAKKVVELSLEITSGKDTAKVSEFASPITVTVNVKGLGDKDKLAVYYFNEEEGKLEFVTGKIKDDKAVLVLSHYSKYAFLESTKSFTDLEGHWAKTYIESMAAKNAVNGYEDGTFKPEEKVTRAQFVKMLVSSLEEKLEAYDGSFTDVADGDWFAPYVAAAKKLGIASGYADGSFKPNKEISRTEMAVMLSSLTDEELTEEDVAKELTVFADADSIPSWAREAVAEVVKAGLMNGDNGSFNPENPAARAEAATVIYRAYNK